MNDQYKTKAQLIEELEQTRKRVTELEHKTEGPGVSEAKYQELFELSPIGITTLDMKGVITSCNPAVIKTGDYSSEDLVGKHFLKIGAIRTKDIPKYVKMFASIIRGKIPKPFELTYQNKDGTIGWSEIYISLLRAEGRLLGVQVLQRDTTKRKQAEELLRESEERFKNLADQSPNMIFVNMKGRLVYVNKRCEEIIGYTREEFCSPDFDFLTLVAPESIELIKANFLKHMQGKEVSPYEYTIITKRGKRIEAINSARLISYKGDTAILGVITDITERKRAENALLDSEEKFRLMFEMSPIGMAMCEMDGTLIQANKAYLEIIGYTHDEAIGLSYWDITPKEYDKDEAKQRHSMKRTGHYGPYEKEYKRKTGERVPVLLNGMVVKGSDGIERIWSIVENITERKLAKEALEQSERRYRELVEDASDVVLTTDPDGYFTYVNHPAEILTGYSKDVLIGMLFTEIVSPEWRDRVQSFYLEQRDNQDRNSTLEFPILTRTGEEKWVEQKVTMLFERNQVTEVQGILRDITERKRAEEVLREMATIDPLTSLYNRRRFSEFLAHEIDRTLRYHTDLSLIMFDLDHFKKINDTHGHEAGDNVLRIFSARMKDNIRESDIIARWGGEEFLILAVNSDLKNAQTIAEKIRADIENQHLAGATKFTVSAGVCQFEYDEDAAAFIDKADKALYRAKNDGRNLVRVTSLKQS